jgi:hypothetical protein
MVSILVRTLHWLLAIVAVLSLLVACGTAETGGASSAPSAQATINVGATAESTAEPLATMAPTQTSASAIEPTGAGTAVTRQTGPVQDQAGLIEALRKAGATVTIGDQIQQPFLSATGTQIRVNGTDVQAFEYADEAAAQADATKLKDTLAGRRTTMISWVASPHAYRAGRVLVLCIGDEPAIRKLLEQTLGAPFAEQQIPAPTSATTAPAATSATSQAETTVMDRASLIDALRARGLNVQTAGEVQQPFFEVSGTTLKVAGADVQVFEFADAAAAKQAMSAIGPDGNPPTMIIDWVAPPHFYQAGKIIALYIGDDTAIIEALTKTLGAQAAGR